MLDDTIHDMLLLLLFDKLFAAGDRWDVHRGGLLLYGREFGVIIVLIGD